MNFKCKINIKAFLAAAVFSCLTAAPYAAPCQAGVAGPAFSDPKKTTPMKDDWKKQPVKYAKWAEGADLALSLDQHMYPAFLSIIEKFAKENSLDIRVQKGTCGISLGVMLRKEADIVGYCCPPGELDRLPGIAFKTVGLASLALIVNAENPIENISLQDARLAFQGKIKKWNEIGPSGNANKLDAEIIPVARLHCKQRPGHWRTFLSDSDQFSPRLLDVGAIADVNIQTASDRRALGGFESLYMTYHESPAGKKIKHIKIDGVSPTDREALAAGRYPIYFAFYLGYWKDGNVHAEKLLNYMIAHAHEVDRKFNLVPTSELKSNGWKFSGDELVGEPSTD